MSSSLSQKQPEEATTNTISHDGHAQDVCNVERDMAEIIIVDETPLEANKRCSLLKLPPEIRNHIYDFVADYEVNAHIKSCRRPGVFAVCRQIRSEFLSWYYSPELMKAEFYDRSSEKWEKVEDPKLLHDLLCGINDGTLECGARDETELRKRAVSDEGLSKRYALGVLKLANAAAPDDARFFSIPKERVRVTAAVSHDEESRDASD